MPPISAAGSASLRKLSVPTRRLVSRWPNTSKPPISSSRRHSRSHQRRLVAVDRLHAAFLHVLDARREAGDAEHVGRAAFEEVGELARLRFAGRVAAGAALAPGAALARAARRTAPRCRSAPAATCGRGTRAGRCAWPARRSAPRRPSGPHRPGRAGRARGRCRPTSAIGCTVPRTLLACVRAMSRVLRRDGPAHVVGVDGAAAVGLRCASG